MGSRYVIVNRAMLFGQAQDECRKRGGHLAHVGSIREQVFLEEFLQQELDDSGTCLETQGNGIGWSTSEHNREGRGGY